MKTELEQLKEIQEELIAVLIDCELHMILSTDADLRRLDRIRSAITKATSK